MNLRPPGPELSQYKLQVLYLVSLRGQRTMFFLAQLYRSCTEQSHEGIPSRDARGARKRNGVAALFDGYEDRKKVEEKSWHASFASTNMVMQAY